MEKKFRKTILISGKEIIEFDDSLEENIIIHQTITEEDEEKIKAINNSGTNKTKYKKDLIHLFHKYIRPDIYICGSCGKELYNAWKLFIYHYDVNKNKIES